MNKLEGIPQDENGQLLMESIINPEEKKTKEEIQEKLQSPVALPEDREDPWLSLGNLSPEQISKLPPFKRKRRGK